MLQVTPPKLFSETPPGQERALLNSYSGSPVNNYFFDRPAHSNGTPKDSPKAVESWEGSSYSDASREMTAEEEEEVRRLMYPSPMPIASREVTARRVVQVDDSPLRDLLTAKNLFPDVSEDEE